MIYDFIQRMSPVGGMATSLHLLSDIYMSQNKNYIVLGYFIARLGLCFHEKIGLYFMAVGHTNFMPDEGFENIRKYVGWTVDVMYISGLRAAIRNSSTANDCVCFSLYEIFNIKDKMSSVLKALDQMKMHFAFQIHIVFNIKSDRRDVFVEVYHTPDPQQRLAQSLSLLRLGKNYINLEAFDKYQPKPLTDVGELILREGVYNVPVKTWPNMSL